MIDENVKLLIESVAEMAGKIQILEKELIEVKTVLSKLNSTALKNNSEIAEIKSKDFMTQGQFHYNMSQR